ncbi:MAG: SCP2 sterol-binding domain-containing protein [Desulfatibacillaceae bacterium]
MTQEIPKDITIKDLLMDFSPKMAKDMIEQTGKQAELADTEFSLVVDVEGEGTFAFVVKDGKEFNVSEGDLDNPLVRVSLSKVDMENMIATNNLDMLLGIQGDLSRNKYELLQRLNGVMVAEIEDDDNVYTINAKFNGADDPTATFRLSAADSSSLVRKETNPVNLFMSGALKIEGDMAFAMSTQPLFT